MIEDKTKVFRPIHYLGSKLRMLNFIEDTINEIDPEKGGVCDLFTGSGSVAFHLSNSRPVTAVDIQEYSKVICSAILQKQNIENNYLNDFLNECKNSSHYSALLNSVRPLIEYEESAIQKALDKTSLEDLCHILEEGSIISYEISKKNNNKSLLFKHIKQVLENFKDNGISDVDSLSIRYFGGFYFSYKQTCQIDSILHQINKADLEIKNSLLAPLLSTMSDAVNTVGKHFAQPIRPRNRKGMIKANLGKTVSTDRRIDIFTLYQKWLKKYNTLTDSNYDHAIYSTDYDDALDKLPNNVSVVYADPPYTREHYSRFYHVLETVCIRDLPKISTIVLKGETILSRGLYREKRHQSVFCIRSLAPIAFDNMFQKISAKGLKLILSYSPYDETKETHPRVVKMKVLIDLAKKYFNNVEVKSVGEFTHSKLTHKAKHLDASKAAEVLIICQ
ncbi:DNA adenine methylase [Winogradskyella algicola]|uniref:DNA adenine methylase n=1 Tax=Winogradskyella algicola TaxID=2575815 RepID=UPI0011088BCF|nr:DNA adenine methylase [Winogradskyella algicola]